VFFNQYDQRGRNKQLVGYRVEEFSEIGNLVAPAREMPVENVGELSYKKDNYR